MSQPYTGGRYVLARLSSHEMSNDQSDGDSDYEMTPVAKRRSTKRAADCQSAHNLSPVKITSMAPIGMIVGLASLRRQKSQAAGVLGPLSLQAANVRLVHLETVWTDFDKAWKALVISSVTEIETSVASDCYVEGEGIYLESKTQLLACIEGWRSSSLPTSSETMHQVVQLADAIKVPKFSGIEADWGLYRQAFQATVHSNPRLNNAQKLLKLLESLEGRAKAAVGSHWSTADDKNFELAWRALCRQYDNEYGTIRAHLRRIHDLKPLQEASCDGLRNVLDTVRGAQRQLQLLLTPEKLSEYFLLYHIELMLDPVSQSDWALKRSTKELPSLDKMYEYLEVKSATLAGMTKSSLTSKQPEEQRRHSAAKISIPSTSFNRGRNTEDRPKCELCPNQFHWPFKCGKFRSLQLGERKAYVMSHGMCINCFSRKHEAGKCPDRVCPRCDKPHNSLLCSVTKNPTKKTIMPEKAEDAATSSSSQ